MFGEPIIIDFLNGNDFRWKSIGKFKGEKDFR